MTRSAARATSSTALRLDGRFRRVRTRAVKPSQPGTGLVGSTKAQSEFAFVDIDGSLVGLWSPGFSSAFSVAGYHFYFLSADRRHGGHVLEVEAHTLELKVEPLSRFHLALPNRKPFSGPISARTPPRNWPTQNKLTNRRHPCFMLRSGWPKPARSSWCARLKPKGSPMSSVSPVQRLTPYSTLWSLEDQNVGLRHEQNAAFIAGGIGRMTGRAGVAIATSGPGVSNLTTGLATANHHDGGAVAPNDERGLGRRFGVECRCGRLRVGGRS